MTVQSLDIRALSVTLQQAVVPLFWGTVALAAVVPIATAAGGWVAGKIDESGGQKQSEHGHYSNKQKHN